MRILILSQVYWPDTAATAQVLSDLGAALVRRGHDVRVLCSRHGYEDPRRVYAQRETVAGVDVRRLRHTGLGKASVWRRLVDFSTFNLAMFWRVVLTRRRAVDVVLGMTSPPLVSFLGSLMARWKGWRFCYWAMDLQPELAIEAGMVRRGSLSATLLERMGWSVFRHAHRIVALDRFMADHISRRGAAGEAITVLPIWPVVDEPWQGRRLENPFRTAQGFADRVVVMYSGNHSVVHPLDTLLEAARLLREDERFLFVFIGGGVRMRDVSGFKTAHGLENIVQLPYQPRSEIGKSLTAADLQVVIMGDGQVGFTHPNKVYGAMWIGCPFVYIGPEPSHVTDLMHACPGNLSVRHGETEKLVESLRTFAAAGPECWWEVGEGNRQYAHLRLNAPEVIAKMIAAVESAMSHA